MFFSSVPVVHTSCWCLYLTVSPLSRDSYSTKIASILGDVHVSCPVKMQLPLPRFLQPVLTFHKVQILVMFLPRQALRSELWLLT